MGPYLEKVIRTFLRYFGKNEATSEKAPYKMTAKINAWFSNLNILSQEERPKKRHISN